MFIIFSGVSASGKNTVMNRLCKERDNIKKLEYSSGTTRPPRETDKEDKTYLFFSEDEFKKGIESGKFFEHEEVHGNYYGILNSALARVIENQDTHFMRDIDVHGHQRIRKYFKGKCPVVSIFLDAPDDVLKERLLSRGESPDRVAVRLKRGQMEREFKGEYDLVIQNNDIEKTVKEVLKLIDERSKKAIWQKLTI